MIREPTSTRRGYPTESESRVIIYSDLFEDLTNTKGQELKSKREGVSTKTSHDGHNQGGAGRDTSRGHFG